MNVSNLNSYKAARASGLSPADAVAVARAPRALAIIAHYRVDLPDTAGIFETTPLAALIPAKVTARIERRLRARVAA